VLDLDINYAGAHNNYANFLREGFRFYEAEKEARAALKIDKENPYALATLGDILADEGYFEEAKKNYEASLDNRGSLRSSAESEIYNNLGWIYAQLKQYDEAKAKFKEAQKLDQMNVKAVRNIRALGKRKFPSEVSRTQLSIAGGVVLYLLVSLYLFWISKFT
jgi:tetratricopeptide (TPR) repeat protein